MSPFSSAPLSSAILAATLAATLGALTWSFFEYVIHRFIGHGSPIWRKFAFRKEHTAHHSKGNYFASTWKKLLLAAGVFGSCWPLATFVAGDVAGTAYTVGFVAFYGIYEVFHRLLHVWEGVGPYARFARRHHFFHHFHDPQKNHGVTSPLWDWVFGTYASPGKIEVPPRLAMVWLIEPHTGEVRPHLAGAFTLRRARPATELGAEPVSG